MNTPKPTCVEADTLTNRLSQSQTDIGTTPCRCQLATIWVILFIVIGAHIFGREKEPALVQMN